MYIFIDTLFFFSTRPCHSSLLPPVLLFSSSSLLIISCIQVFRGLLLPLLPGVHHSQNVLGILSSGTLLIILTAYIYITYSTTEFLTFISFLMTVFLTLLAYIIIIIIIIIVIITTIIIIIVIL